MHIELTKQELDDNISRAAKLIKASKHTTAFTGAGISVESGIPPFRGEKGIWNKYDPSKLEIDYFRLHPKESWEVIKEIFYDFFGLASPNDAHLRIADLQKAGLIDTVITQNVDNLHQEAGSRNVLEFHGTCARFRCLSCYTVYGKNEISLDPLPPFCPVCMGVVKPDFIFFGEGIPEEVRIPAFAEAQLADVFLVVGTTGEVMPACHIPVDASKRGVKIIEVNPAPSSFTLSVTDVFLQGKATEIMNRLASELV